MSKRYPTTTQDLNASLLSRYRDSRAHDRAQLEGDFYTTGTQASISERTGEARDLVRRVFDSSGDSLEREQRGLGLNLSDRAARAQKKRLGLAQAASEVSAGAITRAAEMDRSDVIGDMALSRRNTLENAALSLTEQASGIENQRNIDKVIKRAQKKSSLFGSIGKVVGVAAGAMVGGPAGAAMAAGSLGSGG